MRYKIGYFIQVITALFICNCLFATGSKPGEKSPSQGYSTFSSFEEMATARPIKYFEPVRVSPAGSKTNPLYHGFFFYNCANYELPQFDPTGRYLLGMRVFIESREVTPSDRAEIGIFDLHRNKEWIKIGETTTWNFQQGCRLQWIPGSSEEIIWNDRSEDGEKLVSRVYNTRTKKTNTLPIPIYTISPDGKTALSINFERIVHKEGCRYMGIEDPYENLWAPDNIGIWKMNMHSGEVKMLLSLKEIAGYMYPDGLPSDTIGRTLYFFREGFNPSGNRFIAFVKNGRQDTTITEGFSMDLEGKNVRYFYNEPSHHFWLNDNEIIADGTLGNTGYFLVKDDGSGTVGEKYIDSPNGHVSQHKNGEWFLMDTYNIDGYLYLYMYHIPSKKFIPLAKLENNAEFPKGYTYGPFRVDLHPRFSPDGKMISFDSTHEGLGRQIYIMDISHIVDNPPEEL